jgi:hypothetical protein
MTLHFDKSLVPQADNLEAIDSFIMAVAAGHTTDEELAAAFAKVDRQARYYRLATELLGLTTRDSPNHSVLTNQGRQYASSASTTRRRAILRQLVLSNPLFTALLDFLTDAAHKGRTRGELAGFLESSTGLSAVTAARRVSTIVTWLLQLDLLSESGGVYLPADVPADFVGVVGTDPDESVLLPAPSLVPFQGDAPLPGPLSAGVIQHLVDQAKLERASRSHEEMRSLLARIARRAGFATSTNKYVDLCASNAERIFLFEVKSTTTANYHVQVRGAVSQLYEYRYIQRLPKAVLSAVLEEKPPAKFDWLIDYLCHDRKVLPMWRDGEGFAAPAAAAGTLRPFI